MRRAVLVLLAVLAALVLAPLVVAQLGPTGGARTPPAGEIGVLVLTLFAVAVLTFAIACLRIRRRRRRDARS